MEEITRISDFIVNSNYWRGIKRAITMDGNVEYVMPVSFKTLGNELDIRIKNIKNVLEKENALDNLQRECLSSLYPTVPEIEVRIVKEGLKIYVEVIIDPSTDFLRRQKEVVLREREAFLKMEREGKLTNYRGRFVAILNGGVIGDNEDEMGLIEFLYKEYKNNPPPMYIAKVGEKERVVQMLSPRIRSIDGLS